MRCLLLRDLSIIPNENSLPTGVSQTADCRVPVRLCRPVLNHIFDKDDCKSDKISSNFALWQAQICWIKSNWMLRKASVMTDPSVLFTANRKPELGTQCDKLLLLCQNDAKIVMQINR